MSDKRTPVVEDIEGTNLYLRKGASQRFIEKHCEHCCDGNNQLRINLKLNLRVENVVKVFESSVH